MACSSKAFRMLLLLSCFVISWARLITNDGSEADANKQFVEEVVVRYDLTVRDKDARKGKSRTQTVNADGATISLNRKTRSPQYPHDSYTYPVYPQYNQPQLQYLQYPLAIRQLQNPVLDGPYNTRPLHGENLPPIGHQPGLNINAKLNAAQTQNYETGPAHGNLGHESSNSLSQDFTGNEHGIHGGVALSGNQKIKLPFGLTLTVNYADGFNSNNNNDISRAGSNSVVLSGPDGRPVDAYY